MTQHDVVVVGAGPTGLACGIELQRRGLNVVLFDKGCVVNSITTTRRTWCSQEEILVALGVNLPKK